MTGVDTLDVSGLPAVALGHRAPVWWATVGLMLIEGAMFAMILASYLYYGTTVPDWPPHGMEPPSLLLATIGLVLLVVSILPAYWASEAAAKHDRRGIVRGLALNLAMALVFVVIRGVEWAQLSFRWDSGVYGSLVWTILALHTTHVVSASTETAVVLAIALSPRFGDEHRVGVDADSIYWYFVVGAWVPFYVLLFVVPRLG